VSKGPRSLRIARSIYQKRVPTSLNNLNERGDYAVRSMSTLIVTVIMTPAGARSKAACVAAVPADALRCLGPM
jgi:hypothetical protein